MYILFPASLVLDSRRWLNVLPVAPPIAVRDLLALQGMARTGNQSGRHSSSVSQVIPSHKTPNRQCSSYTDTSKSHRWFRKWKGTATLMSVNIHTQPLAWPDPCCTPNRPEPRIYPHRYHLIPSPFPLRVQSLVAHVVLHDRMSSTRDIPQKNSNWLSRVCMTSTILIQSTCRCSPLYGRPRG